ncbi:MAG: hypothetical protein R3B07_27350 [Polyangiaceae bacterium]
MRRGDRFGEVVSACRRLRPEARSLLKAEHCPVSAAGFWKIPEETDTTARREIVRLSCARHRRAAIFHLGFLVSVSVITRLAPW